MSVSEALTRQHVSPEIELNWKEANTKCTKFIFKKRFQILSMRNETM